MKKNFIFAHLIFEKMENKTLFVDLENVLEKRNPRLKKILPNFVIQWFKRLIHQDDINETLHKIGDKEGLEFLDKALEVLNVKSNVIGIENLPADSRIICASNHPLGGLDGMIFMQVIGKHYGKVKAIINDLLLNIKGLQPLFAGVNTLGKNSREQLQQLNEIFSSEIPMIVFPAGLVSRKINHKICDLKWKKSFISQAIQFKRNIIPIFIDGKNSNSFYRIANLRKFFNLKTNLEMMLLPREFFNYRNKTVTLKIGKPIPYQFFDNSKSRDDWADWVKDEVYKMSI